MASHSRRTHSSSHAKTRLNLNHSLVHQSAVHRPISANLRSAPSPRLNSAYLALVSISHLTVPVNVHLSSSPLIIPGPFVP